MEYHNLKTFVLLPSWKVALYLPLDISISLLKTLSFPLRVEFLYYRKSPPPPPTPSSCSFHSDAFSHFYLWLLLQSCGICGESLQFSSVQFSGSVVSNSLRPHESQHARLPYSSLSHRVCSNLCPLSW